MCTADWQTLRQTHDGECHHMLFFSVLYQSMIRAHLLPLVLGKGRKTLSLEVLLLEHLHQGKKNAKPKELS